ncbi:hypothetical protein [Dyadobacter bucti]|uniref:hypothetical protein n=1 Tax=Dyadobacter bucti TaxID=2572203 RepID=UPI00110A02E7|nr:hypothetical protein [Dyadobacter bucti]
MKKLLRITSLLGLSLLVFSSCCGYKTITCPVSGNPVLYPKSQKCAKRFYEDAVKTWSPTLKATVDVIESVTVDADLSVKNEAQLLKDKLTSEDQIMQGALQTAFLTLTMRPCDGDAMMSKVLTAASEYKVKLETIRANLQSSKDVKSDIKETVKKL